MSHACYECGGLGFYQTEERDVDAETGDDVYWVAQHQCEACEGTGDAAEPAEAEE